MECNETNNEQNNERAGTVRHTTTSLHTRLANELFHASVLFQALLHRPCALVWRRGQGVLVVDVLQRWSGVKPSRGSREAGWLAERHSQCLSTSTRLHPCALE